MADARVFYALWPDGDTARAIHAAADSLAADGRRVTRDRLHLTLAFVGRVDAATVPRLRRHAAAIRVPRFSLLLDRVGHFRRPGVLWLGASSVPSELSALAAELGRAQGGDAVDNRPFRPHVSLAHRAKPPADSPRIVPIEWRVGAFRLVESGGGGAPGGYTCLGQWRLG